ncbi:DNA binding protein [Fragilaria crotonensis]|nr:DNA binding protein [Fragilaria crotonensis]
MFDSDSSAPRKEPSLRRLCQRESTDLTSGGDLMQQTQSLESDALDDVNLPDFVREHHATLTFPEKLMLMLMYVDKEFRTPGSSPEDVCISWILDGRAFIIRRKEDMVKQFLTLFFRQTKFPSFTRKLYRWGFRQVSVAPAHAGDNKREMIFGHEFFQRDNKALMGRMRSLTAAGKRRAMQARSLKQHASTGMGAESLQIEPKEATEAISMQSLTLRPTSASPLYLGPPEARVGQRPGAGYVYGSSLTNLDSTAYQEALLFSHQLKDLHTVRQCPKDNETMEARGGEGGTSTSTNATAAIGYHLPQQSNFDLSFPSAIAAAHQRIRNHQGGRADYSDSDPNAYMRAAVDLLLRYAS